MLCLQAMLIDTRIMRPVLQPENIYAHPHKEQDVILWYNRALWHSIVSSLEIWAIQVADCTCRLSFQSRMDRVLCISAILQRATILRDESRRILVVCRL